MLLSLAINPIRSFASGIEKTIGETLTTEVQKEKSGCVGNNQKSVGALPLGAPMPDIELPKNDKISAVEAFRLAIENEAKADTVEAIVFYERALRALRNSKEGVDRDLAKRIVKAYTKILIQHQGIV